MNNKPVAWVDPYDLERLTHYDCHIGSQKMKNGIPLYTHPVKEQDESFDRTASHMAGEYVAYQKELTDGEIKQIFQEQTGFYFDDNPADDLALMDFAKALLLEAQEK